MGDTNNESFELDSGDEEESAISSTRKNLLLAQMYDDELHLRGEDGKDDELFTAGSIQLDSVDYASSEMNAQTIHEMNDTFDKLCAWRERNQKLFHTDGGDTAADAKDADNDTEIGEGAQENSTGSASWVKEIQRLMESEELGLYQTAEGRAVDLSSTEVMRRAQTLSKLQALLLNIEDVRKANRTDAGAGAGASGSMGMGTGTGSATFADLSRLVEQDLQLGRERAVCEEEESGSDMMMMMLSASRAKEGAARRSLPGGAAADGGRGTGRGRGRGGGRQGTLTTAVADSKDYEGANATGIKERKTLDAKGNTVFHAVAKDSADESSAGRIEYSDDSETEKETKEGVVDADRGHYSDGDGNEGIRPVRHRNADDSKHEHEHDRRYMMHTANDRRVDAFIADELDLHCGLAELGGQLTDFMDDLDKLFPEDAK